MRAARALARAAGGRRGAAIVLEKHLPVAAGLGGGSADAAATLRALTRLWQAELPRTALRAIAAALGADVPACLAGGALRATGAGDRLHRVGPIPRLVPMVLVNPGVALATGAVFSRHRRPFSGPAPVLRPCGDTARLADALAAYRNDLEASARRLAPVIGDVLDALGATPRCLLARMSGSGATCFGLYPTAAAARRAAGRLRRRQPGWWVRATAVAGGVRLRAGPVA